MRELRPYQKEAVAAVQAAVLGGDQRLLYVMATGLGKTEVFVELAKCLPGDGPALVLAHREELIGQAAHRLKEANPDLSIGIERAEHRADLDCAVVVGSVQTLGKANSTRLSSLAGRLRLIVVDEAHHAPAPSYLNVFRRFGCFDEDGPVLVGCTATPKRLDRLNLQAIFQRQVYDYPIRRGIDDGWLADIRGYRVEGKADLSEVKTSAGDFNQAELAAAVDIESRTEAVIDRWMDVAWNRPTVVFCAGIDHAQHVAEAWSEAGIRTEWVASRGMTLEERGDIIAAWKAGDIQVITNVEVLTEGFDFPGIACVAMLRPTKSWSLYLQMVGRGTRGGWRCPIAGKQDLVVLDCVDNSARHSLASVPAILDLPPDLDLEGESVTQAARALDELGEKLAGLKNIKPRTLNDVRLMLKEVDLFASVERPPEIAAATHFAWLGMPWGYFLGCGSERSDTSEKRGPAREARLTQDLLGEYHLELRVGGMVIAERPAMGTDLAAALEDARYEIEGRWPGVGALASSEARWRQHPPSEGQLRMLKKLGVNGDLLGAIQTKGHASDLITARMQSRSAG